MKAAAPAQAGALVKVWPPLSIEKHLTQQIAEHVQQRRADVEVLFTPTE